MTTSVQPLLGECAVLSLEDSIGDRCAKTHAPWHSGPSATKIIAHYQVEDEHAVRLCPSAYR
jgi:hypothetical protein